MTVTYIVRESATRTRRIVKRDSLSKNDFEQCGNPGVSVALEAGLYVGHDYYPPSSIIKVELKEYSWSRR